MNKQFPSEDNKLQNFMTDEQFDQVVEAILAGKYSWACVLILRFIGYNPLHYIPYRTYNRILKQSYIKGQQEPNKANYDPKNNSKEQRNCLADISDLEYLEMVSDRQTEIKGGYRELPLDLSHWFDLYE